MEELHKKRNISRLVRRNSELVRGPALVSALLREERKLDRKIRTLDNDKKHSISHMESEIDFFRKMKQETSEVLSDDDRMSIISEDGSYCSDLEENCSVEQSQQSNKYRQTWKTASAARKIKRCAPFGAPRRAFQQIHHGHHQEGQNRSTTTSHGEQIIGSNLNHRRFSQHTERSVQKDPHHGLHNASVVNVYREEECHPHHHYITKETMNDLAVHRSNRHWRGNVDHDVHKQPSSHSAYDLLKSARQTFDTRVTKEHSSAVNAGPDAHYLAKGNLNTTSLFHKPFANYFGLNTHSKPSAEAKTLRQSFGTVLPLTRNRIEHAYLNPMLFHPRFNNNVQRIHYEDQNSFQALRDCRYLRIPQRHLSPEIEALID